MHFSLNYNVVRVVLDGGFYLSKVFAAPYSLRFPRIHRVRYDKPWHECLDVQGKFFLYLLILKTFEEKL